MQSRIGQLNRIHLFINSTTYQALTTFTPSIMAPSVFFITGCSSGFGAELVKQCISEGDKCIATSRNSSKLSFDGTNKDNFLAVDCDVTKQESVHSCDSLSLYVMLISQPQIN